MNAVNVLHMLMMRSIADISWDELDDIAQHAGAVAVETAHDAGLSTFGVVEGIAIQVTPDRKISILGSIQSIEEPFERAEETLTKSVA